MRKIHETNLIYCGLKPVGSGILFCKISAGCR